MKQETGTVAMLSSELEGGACANRFRNNSTDSSASRASGSSNSSGVPLDFLLCFYCHKKHRGGWFHCEKRKKENPDWRPQRKSKGSKQKSQSDNNSDKTKDFWVAPHRWRRAVGAWKIQGELDHGHVPTPNLEWCLLINLPKIGEKSWYRWRK